LAGPTLPHTITVTGGGIIPDTITGLTPHNWTADANGLFHTTTDLKAEWHAIHELMVAGMNAGLTPIQHLEGNAEAVFDNTGLSKLSATHQAVAREDVQRELDAMGGAMAINQSALGIDPSKPLTNDTYLALEHTLQGNATLQELGWQGHGLNNPPAIKYRGFTNDIQNSVDNTTKYIGGGLNNGKLALADFMDDNIMSHTPFPTVFQGGRLEQLNQNSNAENSLNQAVRALDAGMYSRTYTAADFGKTVPVPVPPVSPPVKPPVAQPLPVPAGFERTLDGSLISNTITETAHTWIAGADGLFHTTTDLNAEWHTIYATMLSGKAATLTAIQRLEGNAEAVFENTGLSKLSVKQQEVDREDVQRQLDAMGAAIRIDGTTFGFDPTQPMTERTYLALEHTLQGDKALEELATQGHGLNNPPSAKYRGFTNDFQNNVDNKTKYIGGGLNNGEKAIADFFDDSLLSHTPFSTVYHNGKLVQLNQNGNRETPLDQAVAALNANMYGRTLTAADFSHA